METNSSPRGKRQARESTPTAKEKQDQSIMETNNSCIVSKRSVEKIYYQKDDGFLRYFVKKFQRRAPLINRGYWLRMQCIEHTVRKFLSEGAAGRKIVVNLGCGYDTMPFNFIASETTLCEGAIFIDVDYEQLIRKKCAIIRDTPRLCELIPEIAQNSPSKNVLLASKAYRAVACNLEDVQQLQVILGNEADLNSDTFLFIAEVSMTYMNAAAAERILAWTGSIASARFALLEQFLPAGPSHPFASQMLKHFEKLNSTLKSAMRFPSLNDQRMRFSKAGWPTIHAISLWNTWLDDRLFPPSKRAELDLVEPFDEWEEFALMAGHYFLITASTTKSQPEVTVTAEASLYATDVVKPVSMMFSPNSSGHGCRRFAAPFKTADAVYIHGGHGTRGRLSDCDKYQINLLVDDSPSSGEPSWTHNAELMCHTISRAGPTKFLLVGGRSSPGNGSAASFVSSGAGWVQTSSSLPYDVYRHCAVTACLPSSSEMVLVFGGKSGSGAIRGDWFLWHDGDGWSQVPAGPSKPPRRFAAAMSTIGGSRSAGLLAGGIGEDGKVLTDIWAWELVEDEHNFRIQCTDVTHQLQYHPSNLRDSVARFGSSMISNAAGLLLVGGICGERFLDARDEILHISNNLEVKSLRLDPTIPRPLLVGCSTQCISETSFLILGGGAVCFSFGTHWNTGSYTVMTNSVPNVKGGIWSLRLPDTSEQRSEIPPAQIRFLDHEAEAMTKKRVPGLSDSASEREEDHTHTGLRDGVVLDALEYRKMDEFESIARRTEPVVVTGLDIGKCTSLWTPEYLKTKVGETRSVVVHVAESPAMSFLAKNFTYKTMPFGDFIDRAERGENVYLRSLSSYKPADQPTDLRHDFPSISADFALPPELSSVTDRIHSMPFRVSGKAIMWLHYDVMANVLCQIQGTKQIVLFPPADVKSLGFPPGASSSRISIFGANEELVLPPQQSHMHPLVFTLGPGDVLFIPALWAHTARPTSNMSVAVNVFFRSLDSGYAAGKDVYGNRDVQAYENGRRDIQRITKAFGALPLQMSKFYLQRLAAELSDIAENWGTKETTNHSR